MVETLSPTENKTLGISINFCSRVNRYIIAFGIDSLKGIRYIIGRVNRYIIAYAKAKEEQEP